MRKLLTDTLCRTMPVPSAGRLDLADLRSSGLSFRVTAAGAKSWNFRFRDPRSGKTTRATIGSYPDLSLAVARERVEEMRRTVASGTNPVEAKRRERQQADIKTFGALADALP
jgi:hypothetical protein